MKSVRNVPFFSDTIAYRLSALSVAHVKRALDTVESQEFDWWEDRLNQTGQVAQLLADRLACAEYSIRKKYEWKEYKRVLDEFGIEYSN